MREIALEAARRHAVATQRFAARRGSAHDGRARRLHRAARLRPDRLDLGRRPLAAARAREPLRPRAGGRARRAPALAGACSSTGRTRRACCPSRDEPLLPHDKERAGGRYQRWFGPILQEHRELADEVHGASRASAARSPRATSAAPAAATGSGRRPSACSTRCGRRGSSRSPAARAWSAATRCPSASCPTRCSGCPTPPLEETRRMQVETRRARARHRERGARLRLLPRQGQAPHARARRSRSSSPRACSSACACASWARSGSCRPRTPSARSPATSARAARSCSRRSTTCSGTASRPSTLFGFEHRLEIYKRPPTRIYGYYVLPLLDGADDRRPHRPQGRPQGRYAAGPGGALAEAAEAARAARGARAARPRARAREERDPEWSLRRARSTPGRSPTR